jgi:ABC-type transport system involved in cytochrome c biogenesis permease subunit
LVHAGIGLMMLSELLVGTSAVESQFTAQDGQVKNFAEDRRTFELAIVDSSGTQADDTVVIHRSLLIEGQTVRHGELPFDATVLRLIPNTAWQFRPLASQERNLATAGFGLTAAPIPERRSTGTDQDAKFEMPAAYVMLTKKNTPESLGTYLLSTVRMSHWDDSKNQPEKIVVGDKQYEVSLRPKRIYKSFWIEVVDARQDNYVGTQTARNFSTDVRLLDADNRLILEKRIWMNNPLRYAGETYYQSGFNDAMGADLTTLQVVSNRGWMIPYVSCMIVAVGLLCQFSFTLLRFVKRRERAPQGDGRSQDQIGAARTDRGRSHHRPDGPTAKPKHHSRFAPVLSRAAPFAVLLLAAVLLLRVATTAPKPYEGMNLAAFGELPVMEQGRCKPFDTLARSTLRIISKQETFRDKDNRQQPAIRWLLDVISGAPEASHHRVFKIENFDLQQLLRVAPRARYLYSHEEIKGRIEQLAQAADEAQEIERQDPAKLTLLQRKTVDFMRRYREFLDIVEAFEVVDLPPLSTDGAAPDGKERSHAEVRNELIARLTRQHALAEHSQPPLAVPTQMAGGESEWETLASAMLHDYVHENLPPDISSQFPQSSAAMPLLTEVLAAYRDQNAGRFNTAVKDYRDYLVEHPPLEFVAERINYESFFNRLAPFYLASWLYLGVFVLAASAWLAWSRPLRRAAFWLAVFCLVLHTFALVSRIYISGRPPVTTLYSSAVFISWGCVLLALILEWLFALGIGSAVAGACGAGALLVAHFLSYDSGDTFPVLVAVLDTQFWLATHVVCVTLGYATTFLAGFLGALFVLLGVCSPRLDDQLGKSLARMVYGTLCFGLFFSFVGTVLGGLWADDSWGRFWGWDPKENGALLIVLWNALVLHARWDGLVKDRGMSVLSIGGNVVTAWSWFGTNELRVGLHSYGFTEGVVQALFIFWGTQLALMLLGALPRRFWWSERARMALCVER